MGVLAIWRHKCCLSMEVVEFTPGDLINDVMLHVPPILHKTHKMHKCLKGI